MVADSARARNGTTTDVMDVVGNAWTDRQLFAHNLPAAGADPGSHVGSMALASDMLGGFGSCQLAGLSAVSYQRIKLGSDGLRAGFKAAQRTDRL